MENNFKIKLSNFRSFPPLTEFSLNKLNLFVGANNTGKSNLSNFFKMLKTFRNKNIPNNSLDYFNINEKHEITLELPITTGQNNIIKGIWKFKPLEYKLISQRNKVELTNFYFELTLNNRTIFIAHEMGDIYKQSNPYIEFFPANFSDYVLYLKQFLTISDYLWSNGIEQFIDDNTNNLVELLKNSCESIKTKNKIFTGHPYILDESSWFHISRFIKKETIEKIDFQISDETSFLFHFILESIQKCSKYFDFFSNQIIHLDFNSINLDIPLEEYSNISFDLIKRQIISKVNEITDIKIKNSNSTNFEIEDLIFYKNNKWHTINEFGSGYKRYLIFLMNLIIQIENEVPLYIEGCHLLEFVFIEEPENFLHPDLQIEFIELIISLLMEKNPKIKRIIIETHSPIIIRTIQHLTLKKNISNKYVNIFDFTQNSIGNTLINQLKIDQNGLLSSPFMTGFDTKLSQIEFELWELRNSQNSKN